MTEPTKEDRFEFRDETKDMLVEAARETGETCWSGGYGARVRRTNDEIIVYRVEEVREL